MSGIISIPNGMAIKATIAAGMITTPSIGIARRFASSP
jgi:hypothetical protein